MRDEEVIKMIGCKICHKEVEHNPPANFCPHCGNKMVYVPLGTVNFIGEVVYNTVRVMTLGLYK